MCGIVGIVRRGQKPLPHPTALRRMMSSIEHRGPDGGGEFLGEWAQLGAVRLAVVDLKSGAQPVSGCGEALRVVHNGEIYNHHSIRQKLSRQRHAISSACDSEVIPHLYEEHGPTFVEMLRGMFAFALWDEHQRKLLLGRDRMGIKPLFLHETPDFLVFASEIKAIIASGLMDPKIDLDSLDDLFTLSYPCPPRTMFAGILELLPAHTLELDGLTGRIQVRRYWQCPFPPAGEHRRIGWRQASEELLSLLRMRVYDHLTADVPVGVYLSGGLDSSVIGAVVRDVTGDSPSTFSVGFEDSKYDELDEAGAVNAHLGCVGHSIRCSSSMGAELEKMIWHTELPLQFPLAIPLMNLAGLARSHGYPVVMTGEGADEIFGGYDCFRADKMRRVLDRPGMRFLRPAVYRQLYKWHELPVGTIPRMLQNLRNEREIRSAFGGMIPPWFDMWTTVGLDRDRLLGIDSRTTRSVWDAPSGFDALIPRDVDRLHPHNAAIALELVTRLPAWILLIGDRASMANGVEARVPFLDHEIVEFVASLPPALKLHGFREKAILRHAAKGILPARTAMRPKRPFFTPIKEWFFGENAADLVEEALSKDAIVGAGLFDADLVAEYRRQLRLVPDNALLRHQLEWTLILILGTQILHRQFVQERCFRGPRK